MANERKTVVVGLGKTGLACLRFLHARGVPVAVTDSRAQPPGLDEARRLIPDLTAAVGGFDRELLRGSGEIVLSPGVALTEPALAAASAAGVPVVSEIELFARQATAPVIAITGSNGKSTVTTLVGAMAAAAGIDAGVGGNLGTPALDLLTDPEPALYVLELSSFQLETTRTLAPQAAVVLNLSPDHMDRYPTVSAYADAKARVYARARTAVVNLDDARVRPMAPVGRAMIGFGLDAPSRPDDFGLLEHEGETWLARGETPLLSVAELKIPGRHNQANALAALALGDAVGFPMDAMLEALRGFRGLPHRSQWVAERAGAQYYDDSKGTNVGATVAAVAGMPAPLILIAGGDGKGADFAPLLEALEAKARLVVLIGRDGPLIAKALGEAVPHVFAEDMEAAVRRAAQESRPGDTVLLSPACASFDMFSGYEERGRVFAEAVGRLTE